MMTFSLMSTVKDFITTINGDKVTHSEELFVHDANDCLLRTADRQLLDGGSSEATAATAQSICKLIVITLLFCNVLGTTNVSQTAKGFHDDTSFKMNYAYTNPVPPLQRATMKILYTLNSF